MATNSCSGISRETSSSAAPEFGYRRVTWCRLIISQSPDGVHGGLKTQHNTLTKRKKIIPTFQIVDETPEFIVVDKPPFLQAHPSKPWETDTLWNGLRDLLAYEIVNGGQVSIVNRLDRETSGLTLVAKTRESARFLCMQMEARRIGKEYLAIVWGWPNEEEWTVEAPILRQGDVRPSEIYLKQTVHPDGVPALTRFRVEQRLRLSTCNGNEFSVVRAFPETGRMHQIRVHLAHSGHSLVGDKIYGPDERCYLEFIETGWTPELASRLLLSRHALHSAVLRVEETENVWSAPLARDLTEFLRGSEGSSAFVSCTESRL